MKETIKYLWPALIKVRPGLSQITGCCQFSSWRSRNPQSFSLLDRQMDPHQFGARYADLDGLCWACPVRDVCSVAYFHFHFPFILIIFGYFLLLLWALQMKIFSAAYLNSRKLSCLLLLLFLCARHNKRFCLQANSLFLLLLFFISFYKSTPRASITQSEMPNSSARVSEKEKAAAENLRRQRCMNHAQLCTVCISQIRSDSLYLH